MTPNGASIIEDFNKCQTWIPFSWYLLIRKQIASDRTGFWSVEENGIEFHPAVENVSLKAQIVDSSFHWKVSRVFPTIWHLDTGLFVFFSYKYLQKVDIRSGKDPVQHLPPKRKYNIKDLIGW